MKPGRKPLPRATKTCVVCGETFAHRNRGEGREKFARRQFCSLPCSHKGRTHVRPAKGYSNGHVTIPSEPLARILRRELTRYSAPDLYSVGGEAESLGVGRMAEDIAQSQGLRAESVERRLTGIINGTTSKSRDKTRRLPGEVKVSTVEWILDGLALPDAWHVELYDWHRILLAYEAGHITLREYRGQSALYNLIAKAEAAAVSTRRKATASDQRRVAA